MTQDNGRRKTTKECVLRIEGNKSSKQQAEALPELLRREVFSPPICYSRGATRVVPSHTPLSAPTSSSYANLF